MNWTIRLPDTALEEIKKVANARQATNRNSFNPDGAVIDSYKADFLGAIGEATVSTIMKLEWDGKLFTFEDWIKWRKQGNDVSGLEVKCTDHDYGRLWVRENDVSKPDAPYVLVKANNLPYATVAGWAYGKEIRNPKYLKNYGAPAYYLPNDLLRSMNSLLELITKVKE